MARPPLASERAAMELLAEALAPGQLAYPRVWTRRAVFIGRPLDGLLRAAAGASLLVVGASSARSRHQSLLGSTSLDAISRATSPVAVVPSPAMATDVPRSAKETHDVPA